MEEDARGGNQEPVPMEKKELATMFKYDRKPEQRNFSSRASYLSQIHFKYRFRFKTNPRIQFRRKSNQKNADSQSKNRKYTIVEKLK